MAQTDRDENGVYTGPDEKTITLRKPIPRKGSQEGDLTAITVKEPTAKQLSMYLAKINSTNDDGIEALVLLTSLTSGIPPNDVEKLSQRDLDDCGQFLMGFTRVPQKSAP